jgi:hypothetical protein
LLLAAPAAATVAADGDGDDDREIQQCAVIVFLISTCTEPKSPEQQHLHVHEGLFNG